VPDYSEFPTTPTAWQERAWADVAPLPIEAPPQPARRRVDLVALIPGVAFITIAVVLLSGVDVPHTIWDGGVLWAALVVVGVVLLARELRRSRHRR
jgi:hypothetical protein